MAAEHDQLVRLVSTGNFGQRIVTVRIGVLIFDGEIDRHGDLFAGIYHSGNAIEMFDRRADLDRDIRPLVINANRRICRRTRSCRRRLNGGCTLNKDRAAVSACRVDQDRGTLFSEKTHSCRVELLHLCKIRITARAAAGTASGPTDRSRVRSVRHIQEFGIGETFAGGFHPGLDLTDRADKHDLAFQLALVLFKLGDILCVKADNFAGICGARVCRCRSLVLRLRIDGRRGDQLISAGRPCLGVRDKRKSGRPIDHRRKPLERPAAAERSPRFEVCVLQTPFSEGVASPLVGSLGTGRRGQPRPDNIGHIAERLHDLRVLCTFFLDLIDDLFRCFVDLRSRLSERERRQQKRINDQNAYNLAS